MKNCKLFVIAGGFYYFGEQVDAPPGYVALKSCSMSGGFSGGKGMPGVCRGDKAAKITLDRFEENSISYFPETACYGIHDSINLYEFKGTTIR